MRFFTAILKRFLTHGLLLTVLVIFIGVDVGECSERIFYSIHLASFKSLRNANIEVNALKKKRKTVFWKETDVPEKGKFYRIYLGRYKNRDEALGVWKKLKKENMVSYLGIHKFTETVERKKTVRHHAKVMLPKADTVRTSKKPEHGKRFIGRADDAVIDRETNLMWIKNGWRLEFFSAVTWWDAVEKCKNFRHGGYTNWRLPTLKEWESIISVKNECPALIEPNLFENIITHMPYWIGTDFIYSPGQNSDSGKAVRAYTVMLYYGRFSHQNKNIKAFILPVRSIE